MILSARILLALVPFLRLSRAAAAAPPAASNATTTTTMTTTSYTNPILPGWHSDPSCVFVTEGAHNNTAFCTTSSFMAFPGNPVYASRDLTTWALASHAVNRVAQFPEIRTATNQQFAGMFANTLRYHRGTFYLITAWINTAVALPRFVLFTTTDPFDAAAWSDGLWVDTPGFTIDPDLFFDDDGSVIMASSGSPILACRLDVATGKTIGEPWSLWNGTGGSSAEGPHLYRKDGWYYLLVAEGGTQLNHSATLARSRTLAPNATWEPAPRNPLVSNRGTDAYFQTVGHADLFQDGAGNWWGVALATRGGPDLYNQLIFPMGRETVLYPVSWPAGDWPVAEQVRGTMRGPLPATTAAAAVGSVVVGTADAVDFAPGTSIPPHWLYWRAPFDPATFAVSPADAPHPHTLRIAASRANLSADAAFDASREGLSAVFRRQEHSYFNFSVDLHLHLHDGDGGSGFGGAEGDELGVSNLLNQDQHVDVGIVYLPPPPQPQGNTAAATAGGGETTGLKPYFRVRARSVRYAPVPEPIVTPVPSEWLSQETSSASSVVRIRISPRNESHYEVFASQGGGNDDNQGEGGEAVSLAVYTTALLSGDGAGSGGLLGVYATTNGGGDGGNRTFDAYVSRWRYEPVAQIIDYGVVEPVKK